MGTSKKGFTLIELLVVIAIIAILAAILFPIFARVQETAKLSKCLNNMKQIAMGCMAYEGDNDGWMVKGFNNDADPWGDWYSNVNQYIKQVNITGTGANKNFDLRGVWMCPNMPKSYYYSSKLEIPSNLKRAYGYNYAYLGGYANASAPGGRERHRSSEVAKASKTVRVLEIWAWNHQWDKTGGATHGWGTAYCYPPVKVAALCKPNQCWPPGWHSGGKSTVGWCDGHVSAVKLVPPQPDGSTSYPTGWNRGNLNIMQETFRDLGDTTNQADPWFRAALPKP